MKVKIRVMVTYWVEKEMDLPQDVVAEIEDANSPTIYPESIAGAYLSDNISEDEAHEWMFDVNEIERVKEEEK